MFILENVKKWAKTDRLAAIGEEGKITYAEFEARSEALAAFMLDTFPDKAPVVLWGDKEHDMLTGVLAALKTGRPYVMIPNYLPEKRVAQMVEGCHPVAAFNFSKTPFPLDTLKTYEKADVAQIFADYAGREVDPSHWIKKDDLVCVFYTSGSTGVPKGVKITRRNIEAFVEWWYSLSNLGIEEPRWLNFTPYAFSSSIGTIYNGMGMLGAVLYEIDKPLSSDYPRLLEFIFDANPHYFDCTPSFANICMQEKRFCGDFMTNMRQFSVGGEPLSHEIAKRLLEKFPNSQILNGYGATETTIGTIICEVTPEMANSDKPMPIGYTSFNSRVEIWDEEGHPLPDGETGELIIISDMVTEGYLNDPERTAQNYFVAPDGVRGYHTHDLVYRENDLIYYVGRADNLVKVGGYRVEIEEVERYLSRVSGVSKCAVAPATKDERVILLAAYVVLEEGVKPGLKTTIAIKKEMGQYVHPYMVPQKIVYVDELPYNTNGKVDRKTLKEMSVIRTSANL